MPYISEEIWQRVAPLAGVAGDSIMRQPYPEYDEGLVHPQSVDEMRWVMDFISGVRQIRSGMDIAPSKPLPILLANASEDEQQKLADNQHYLEFLARTERIDVLANADDAPESATALVGEMKVLVPMAGLIDKAAEIARLSKEIEKKEKDVERVDAKLANPQFVERAQSAVVEKERARIKEMHTTLESLRSQLERIQRM